LPAAPSQLPLQGIRVLDLSAVISGPMATALLADQGAEVIKVEPPAGDQCRRIGPAQGDLSAMFISVNRGKRSIVLDLKRPQHVDVVHALARRADVLVENFRPGAMQRLGLGAEALCAANPRLVYASISGFGPNGPYADARVYDAVIQAVSGVSASHPNPLSGEPSVLATTVCDKLTALNAAQAICAALLARERNGKGTRVQLSMLDAALSFQWPDAMNNLSFVSKPPRAFPEFGVRQRAYKTRDGHVATMTPQQSEFAALCRGLDHPELADDPRFASGDARRHNVAELVPLLESLIAEHDTDELVDRLRAAGVPIGRVNLRHEVLSDAQVLHNQALVEVDHGDAGTVRLARPAARFGLGAGVAPVPGVAPHLGQHGREVLEELGYDTARIDGLLAAG
jgi:crotonobetainyl-CoA:carnitine CoA-transferase CaiB-like acyl-CoA transferase